MLIALTYILLTFANKLQCLKLLPENILYHELVEYDTHILHSRHNLHKRDLSSFINFSFRAFNKLFYLNLKKNNDLFADDVTFTSSDGDVDYDFYDLVKGHCEGEPDSYVHGSIHEGIFEGVITCGNESYHIERSDKYLQNPDKHSLIYRLSDVNMDSRKHKCGVDLEYNPHNPYTAYFNESHNVPYNKAKYYNRRRRDAAEDTRKTRYCTLFIGADYKFYTQHSSNSERAIISKLGTYVEQVNRIFSSTVFEGYSYRVQFLLQRVHVYTNEDNKFDERDYDSAKFLDITSTMDSTVTNPDNYCLVYMFTHRDFSNGVLGLAWVATASEGSGGLCNRCRKHQASEEKRCLNSGIVTTKNVIEIPAMQSYLTFAHELGHNLGSPHDPNSEGGLCAPGTNNGGMYLMYAHSNKGDQPNNAQFSECSKDIMGPIINIRGTCFKETEKVCGNFKLDKDEDCDCGDEVTCSQDKCCKNCEFSEKDYTCSLMDGPCCNKETCTPYQTGGDSVTCAEETECRKKITCKNNNKTCPVNDGSFFKSNDTLCNEDTQVCTDGLCKNSLCAFGDTVSCQCSEEEYLCDLCCTVRVDGDTELCVPATNTTYFTKIQPYLDKTTQEMKHNTSKLLPGSVCGDNTGYCDVFYTCRIVDADGPIARLGNYIFNGVLFNQAEFIAKQYWYYCIMLAVGIVCFMVAFIAVCSKTVKPPPLPEGGQRMSYPVTYKNINHNQGFELSRHR